MSELNPCPQCGSEPDLIVGHQESWVVCRPCDLAVAVGATTGDAAINAWNDVTANFTRPIKTLRDEFAMAALTGILAYPGCDYYGSAHNNGTPESVAMHAYVYADAMLSARKNKEV